MVTNPYASYNTTNAAGSFNTTSTGYVQGMALDNPAARQFLSAGVLANAETVPMWDGVAISEYVSGAVGNPALPNKVLGPQIGRATTVTPSVAGSITGFSVSDQNYSAINSASNTVPLIYSGGQVNFYRLGSNQRIPVKMDPNLVDLEGNIITSQVSWDFANQQLVPYATATVTSGTQGTATTISSGTYTAASGAVSLTTNAAHGLVAGDTFTLASMTGTNAATYLNGTFVAGTGTTGSTLVFSVATGLVITITGGNLLNIGISMGTSAPHGLLPGDTFELSAFTGTGFSQLAGEWVAAVGTTGSTIRIVASSALTAITFTSATVATGGVLPNVRILEVQIGNCMTVNFNATTGVATWNRNDSVAIILI